MAKTTLQTGDEIKTIVLNRLAREVKSTGKSQSIGWPDPEFIANVAELNPDERYFFTVTSEQVPALTQPIAQGNQGADTHLAVHKGSQAALNLLVSNLGLENGDELRAKLFSNNPAVFAARR